MNLIQSKQIQGLDQTFIDQAGNLQATGAILIDFMSGQSVFSGQKTFTGITLFNNSVDVRGTLSGTTAKFENLGINLSSSGIPEEAIHVSGANLLLDTTWLGGAGGYVYASGGIWITGQNGEPTNLIPEWVRNDGALYQSGMAVINVGFNEPSITGTAYVPETLNVSGGIQALGDVIVSGNSYISGTTSGHSDAYFQRIFTTGADGQFFQLSGQASGAGNLSTGHDARGEEGTLQYKTGAYGFTGKTTLAFDPDDNELTVGGPITASGLISGSGNMYIEGPISGASFHATAPGTKYFSGNSNVEVIADNKVVISGDARSELHNAVPYYNFEEVSTTPHIYDLTLAVEGYRTDITAFSVGLPTPTMTESGQKIVIKDITGNASTNLIAVTGIDCTIDGGTGNFLSGNFGSWSLFSDGNNWFSLNSGKAGAVPPGGYDAAVQFNNLGAFGGSPDLTWNGEGLYANGYISGVSISGISGTYDSITLGGAPVSTGDVLWKYSGNAQWGLLYYDLDTINTRRVGIGTKTPGSAIDFRADAISGNSQIFIGGGPSAGFHGFGNSAITSGNCNSIFGGSGNRVNKGEDLYANTNQVLGGTSNTVSGTVGDSENNSLIGGYENVILNSSYSSTIGGYNSHLENAAASMILGGWDARLTESDSALLAFESGVYISGSKLQITGGFDPSHAGGDLFVENHIYAKSGIFSDALTISGKEVATLDSLYLVSGDTSGLLTTGISTQTGLFSEELKFKGVDVSTGDYTKTFNYSVGDKSITYANDNGFSTYNDNPDGTQGISEVFFANQYFNSYLSSTGSMQLRPLSSTQMDVFTYGLSDDDTDGWTGYMVWGLWDGKGAADNWEYTTPADIHKSGEAPYESAFNYSHTSISVDYPLSPYYFNYELRKGATTRWLLDKSVTTITGLEVVSPQLRSFNEIRGGGVYASGAKFNGSVSISGGGVPAWSGAPSAYSDPGTPGAIAYDANFVYVCTGDNAWGRAGLAAWP